MNNSGLKCRRWRESNARTGAGPLSGGCAAGSAGQSTCGPLWAPLHRFLMSVQEEECAFIKSLGQFWTGGRGAWVKQKRTAKCSACL